jgi:putative ABC transport system substrate-binding protein
MLLSRPKGAGMRRREFLSLLGGAAATLPLAARAQHPGRIPRIGYLSPVSAASGFLARDELFRQGLRDLGYVEGTNIAIEYRFADGRFDRLPALAAELVQLNVNVIVTAVTQASLAARDATKTIPIVIAGVSDPVGSGLIANLARPGGNITGTSSQTSEVVGKSLEFLKEAIPRIGRVAALWNPANAVFQTQMLKQAETAAAVLRIQLKSFGVRDADELGSAFTAIAQERVDALLVLADPLLIGHQKRIIEFALKQRLPAIYATKEHAAAGGLMTYGPNIEGQFRRAATYVDKILKGAKPADLPVEQPTQFELVINLKTAKALGISIPTTLLGRADEVIE